MTNLTAGGCVPVMLDSSGGAALFGPCGNRDQGRRLVLEAPGLRALDLHDDSLLEVLDLRGCGGQHHLHLQLDRLPQLRELHLPTLTAGAVIHLFQPALPRTLRIRGAVCEIDANWQQGTLRLVHPTDAWQGVQLLGHDATRADLAPRIDPHPEGSTDGPTEPLERAVPLNILLGAEPLPEALTLTASGDWLLADAFRLKRLTLDGPQMVTLQRAHALRQLQVRGARRVRGEGLDQLAVIDAGSGQHRQASDDPCLVPPDAAPELQLQGKMTRLQIADAWSGVQLRAPKLQSLQIAWANRLSLLQCERLEAVDLPHGLEILCEGALPTPLMQVARFYVDEATLNHVLRRLEAGEHDLLPRLLQMLAQGGAPATVFHHLTTLLRLAEQGFDPVALWDCRRAIAAWQREHRRRARHGPLTEQDLRAADQHWDWTLPRDRLDEGLYADLQLWALCVAASPAARDYGRILERRLDAQTSLHHLVRLAVRPQVPAAVIDLLLRILIARQRQGQWESVSIPDELRMAVPYLTRLLSQTQPGQADFQAVLEACLHWSPWERLPDLVPRLLALHPGPTRALLMQWVQRHNDWFERRLGGWPSTEEIQAARLQLTRLALMPLPTQTSAAQVMADSASTPRPPAMPDDLTWRTQP